MASVAAPRPALVIVTGPPASGKTTLGQTLADALCLPFIHKDGLKETLFDALGVGDRVWSRQLGVASYALLFHVAEALLAAGDGLVAEANFYAEWHSEPFARLGARYSCAMCQVVCVAEGETLLARYRARESGAARHPGHAGLANLAEFEATLLRGRVASLAVAASMIEVDTTDFATVEYAALAEEVTRRLAGQADGGGDR